MTTVLLFSHILWHELALTWHTPLLVELSLFALQVYLKPHEK